MIELTKQQVDELEHSQSMPPRIVNPQTKETFVLLRVTDYERLKVVEYDDSPWTREEREAHNWELADRADWEEHEGASEKS